MLPLRLVDFHCHLDLYPNYGEVFSQCARAGVEVLAVTTTPRAWEKNKDLASGHEAIRVGLGLHPQLVADGHDEIELFERLLRETRYVGEVGLDAGPRYFRTLDAQRRIFERVLARCAEFGDKILSIHSVRTAREVLALLEKHLPSDRGRAVLHWFSGSKAEARKAAELGCYFSINVEMLKRDSGRTIILSLPKDRLLTETDGPFTLTDNRPSQPGDVSHTIELLAAVLKEEPAQLVRRIRENLEALEAR
jgi:TatD DNase family protein